MTAFTRAYRLTVGDVLIDASTGVGANSARIRFKVERDVKRVPNSAEFEVTNLTRGHRDALAKLHNVPVHLEAGYVGDLGTVFLGDLRSARTTHDGTEFITKVSSGDGESKVRTASISRTFASGTAVGTVISAMAKALGVKPGNIGQFAGAKLANGSSKLTRGLTIHGPVYDELERITTSCGLAWSIQDGVLQIRERGLPVNGTRGALLRADTGLVGDPEVEIATETKDGVIKGQPLVHGVCLLRTDVAPGQPLHVESNAFKGNLVCISTVQGGDTHASSDWTVQWSGRPY